MRACFIALLLVALSPPAFSQSLADVARKEGERRQQSPSAPKTFTNADLKPVRTPEVAADPDGPAPAAEAAAQADAAVPSDPSASAAATPAAGKSAKEPVRDRAYWERRQAELRDQLSKNETLAEALQTRVNALTMDFINRDDPVQRDQIERDRTRALEELDRLKKAVEQDRRAILDLQEEARRAAVPAGWLR